MKGDRQVIAIIGLGCIGTSLGLALRASADAEHLEIIGVDIDPGTARKAQKAGAVDRVEYNLDLALRKARLVVLAVPLAALRETLESVGHLLEPDSGVVVTDIAPLKGPVREWAAASLPAGVYYVGGNLFLAPGAGGWEPLHGQESAQAALLRDAMYVITATHEEHSSAVKAVANLARVIGATPLFMDPVEHDAVQAMMQGLPALLSTALLQAALGMPGWAEMRKAADRSFATATAAAEGDPISRRMMMLLGRETLLRGLAAVEAETAKLRATLETSSAEELETAFKAASEARGQWVAESKLRAWEVEPRTIDTSHALRLSLETLIGGWAGRGNSKK